jgi:hypothetical protein
MPRALARNLSHVAGHVHQLILLARHWAGPSWQTLSIPRGQSEQARRRGAFLQHGSIPIRLEPSRLASVLGAPVDGSRFIDLERAVGATVTAAALDQALVVGFEEAFGVRLRHGALTESESLRAAELRCWKYDSIAWTRDGVIGAREARWGPAVAR